MKHVCAWIASRLLLPTLDGSSYGVGQSSPESPMPFDFCCQDGLTRSLARLLTRCSQHTRAHLAQRERERFPFLTPITHEVLIPYDGCQSPAVYISTTLRHPLIFLSSILVITVTFFFFFFLRAPGNQISRCFQYGLSDLRMYGWMYGWMQGFAS